MQTKTIYNGILLRSREGLVQSCSTCRIHHSMIVQTFAMAFNASKLLLNSS